MVQRLESIKGGGGSIKVGTTGTISALMTQELDTVKSTPETPPPSETKPQPRKSTEEASTSKIPEISRKIKTNIGKSQLIPMLGSENIALDRTPSRVVKTERKGSITLVEVVDIKCGNNTGRKTWARPIKHRLKKLGFSKLSGNNIL